MKKVKQKHEEIDLSKVIYNQNNLFIGDRQLVFPEVKKSVKIFFNNLSVEPDFFEIEKLQISVHDIRSMKSFVNKTTESVKIVLLSSFFWSSSSQNAMLKILEETPENTFIYIFGNSQNKFLPTILSRVQKNNFLNVNRFANDAAEVLKLAPNERLDSKIVKKILNMKVIDENFEKDTENEKKDRESHVLFLKALIDICLKNRNNLNLEKNFISQVYTISIYAEIDGGSPHLFVDWLLLSCPLVN